MTSLCSSGLEDAVKQGFSVVYAVFITCIYVVFGVDTSSHHSPITDDFDLSQVWRKEAIPFKTVDGMSKLSSCT